MDYIKVFAQRLKKLICKVDSFVNKLALFVQDSKTGKEASIETETPDIQTVPEVVVRQLQLAPQGILSIYSYPMYSRNCLGLLINGCHLTGMGLVENRKYVHKRRLCCENRLITIFQKLEVRLSETQLL